MDESFRGLQYELSRFIGDEERRARILELATRLSDIKIGAIDDEALQDLEGLGIALIAAARKETLSRGGWKYEGGWGGPGAPGAKAGGGSLEQKSYSFLDHVRRWVHEEDERVIYTSEPYGITPEDFREILSLVRRGRWTAMIDDRLAVHNPGVCPAICFERSVSGHSTS